MEHGGDADAGAEMLGIGGDGEHGLGRGPEQQIVDNGLVVIGDVGDLGRQGEDEVEVADGQEISFAFGEPVPRRRALAFGAVAIATGVVGDPAVVAVFASFDMAAEGGRAAALNGRHHLELAEADMAGMALSPCWAVAKEDIRDLQ